MENDPNEVGKQKNKNWEPLKNVIFDPGEARPGWFEGNPMEKSFFSSRDQEKSLFFRFGPKIWRAGNFEPGYLRAQKELGDKQDI